LKAGISIWNRTFPPAKPKSSSRRYFYTEQRRRRSRSVVPLPLPSMQLACCSGNRLHKHCIRQCNSVRRQS